MGVLGIKFKIPVTMEGGNEEVRGESESQGGGGGSTLRQVPAVKVISIGDRLEALVITLFGILFLRRFDRQQV